MVNPHKLLVTGGAGFIGSRLVPWLMDFNIDITVVDPLMYGVEGLLGIIDHPQLTLRATKVAADLELGSGFMAVFHLAGIVGEPACKAKPGLAEEANYESVARLVGRYPAATHVLFSTCSVYGVNSGAPCDEDDRLTPLGNYATSRMRAEGVVRAAGGIILRLGTVYGISPRPRFDTLFNEFAYRAAFGLPIDVYGVNQLRPYLAVTDLLRALGAVDLRGGFRQKAATYNLVSFNCSKQKLADLATRYGATITQSDSGDDARNYSAAGHRFAKDFGWSSARDPDVDFGQLVEIIRQMHAPHLARYRNNS